MTLREYNEDRWRCLAKKYSTSIKRARIEYKPVKEVPEWARKIHN